MSTEWYLINSPHYTGGTEKNDFRFNANLGIDDFLIDSPFPIKFFFVKGSLIKKQIRLKKNLKPRVLYKAILLKLKRKVGNANY